MVSRSPVSLMISIVALRVTSASTKISSYPISGLRGHGWWKAPGRAALGRSTHPDAGLRAWPVILSSTQPRGQQVAQFPDPFLVQGDGARAGDMGVERDRPVVVLAHHQVGETDRTPMQLTRCRDRLTAPSGRMSAIVGQRRTTFGCHGCPPWLPSLMEGASRGTHDRGCRQSRVLISPRAPAGGRSRPWSGMSRLR